jgi:hypothetical protein
MGRHDGCVTTGSTSGEAVERVPLGPERWLLDLPRRSDDPPGVARVSELLPTGYPCYLRLFHPFLPWDSPPSGSSDRHSWRNLAADAGVTYHAELAWNSLLPALDTPNGQRRFETWEGEIEPHTAGALFAQLSRRTSVPVYYFFGLGAVVASDGPLLYRAPADAIDAVRDRAARDGNAPVPGPELAWPEDRTWVVNTDYDLSSSYIACDATLASSLVSDAALELLAVTLDARVDNNCDTLNRPAGTSR